MSTETLKRTYDEDSGCTYIYISDKNIVRTEYVPIAGHGMRAFIDFDENGNVVGIEIG